MTEEKERVIELKVDYYTYFDMVMNKLLDNYDDKMVNTKSFRVREFRISRPGAKYWGTINENTGYVHDSPTEVMVSMPLSSYVHLITDRCCLSENKDTVLLWFMGYSIEVRNKNGQWFNPVEVE